MLARGRDWGEDMKGRKIGNRGETERKKKGKETRRPLWSRQGGREEARHESKEVRKVGKKKKKKLNERKQEGKGGRKRALE